MNDPDGVIDGNHEKLDYWKLTFGFAGVVFISLCVSIYAFTRLEAIQNQATALANESLPGAILMGQIAAISEREVALVLPFIDRLCDDVKGDRLLAMHQVPDTEVGPRHILGNHRIAIDRQIG